MNKQLMLFVALITSQTAFSMSGIFSWITGSSSSSSSGSRRNSSSSSSSTINSGNEGYNHKGGGTPFKDNKSKENSPGSYGPTSLYEEEEKRREETYQAMLASQNGPRIIPSYNTAPSSTPSPSVMSLSVDTSSSTSSTFEENKRELSPNSKKWAAAVFSGSDFEKQREALEKTMLDQKELREASAKIDREREIDAIVRNKNYQEDKIEFEKNRNQDDKRWEQVENGKAAFIEGAAKSLHNTVQGAVKSIAFASSVISEFGKKK